MKHRHASLSSKLSAHQLETMRTVLAAKEEELQACRKEATRLHAALESGLGDAASRAQASEADLRAAIAELEMACASREALLATSQTELAAAREGDEDGRRREENLLRRLADSEATSRTQAEMIMSLQGRLIQREETIDRLQQRLNGAEAAIAAATKREEELRVEVGRLQSELEEAGAGREKAVVGEAAAKEALRARESEHRKQLENQREVHSRAIDSEVREAQVAKQKAEQEISDLKANFEQLERELKKYQVRVLAVEEELSGAKEEIDRQKSGEYLAQQAHLAAKETLRTTEETAASLRVDLQAATAEITELRATLGSSSLAFAERESALQAELRVLAASNAAKTEDSDSLKEALAQATARLQREASHTAQLATLVAEQQAKLAEAEKISHRWVNSIEKGYISSFIVQLLAAGQSERVRGEILETLARLLEFGEEERQRVGLSPLITRQR